MKQLMAANWKMYKTRAEAAAVATELAGLVKELPEGREVLVCPPFTAIDVVAEAFAGKAGFHAGGQDLYPAEEGAYTGEISPLMLRDAGATYVLTGHSERRHVIGESGDYVGQKTAFAVAQGLTAVLCIGETIEEREAGKLEAVLKDQLASGLSGLAKDVSTEQLVIAYEPVWAIGTGKTATPADVAEAHALVRSLLKELLPMVANSLRILYGGSVKPANAAELMALDNVDGVLVGGASLQAESFAAIVTA